MNLIQLQRYGKSVNCYFTNDLKEIAVIEGSLNGGRHIELNADDKLKLLDIIEQELYVSVQSYLARNGAKDA
jgi:hypothetical protein